MPAKRRKRKKPVKGLSRIIIILIFISAAVFLLIREFGIEKAPVRKTGPSAPEAEKKQPFTDFIPPGLPKVSIVMDDLGSSKKAAEDVLNINASITLAILPLEVYTEWIAEEGHRRGHEILAHIPMEAVKPLNLGKGGLYTWMTDAEIIGTLNSSIKSIPHMIGISNHMGSAFTKDRRAIQVVLSQVKKRRLLFLDSMTTSESVGYSLAKSDGIKSLKRDVFLDNNDSPSEIEYQWKRLVNIARQKGYAIATAHPRKNTIAFLGKILENNTDVVVVPLSELLKLQS